MNTTSVSCFIAVNNTARHIQCTIKHKNTSATSQFFIGWGFICICGFIPGNFTIASAHLKQAIARNGNTAAVSGFIIADGTALHRKGSIGSTTIYTIPYAYAATCVSKISLIPLKRFVIFYGAGLHLECCAVTYAHTTAYCQ